MDGHWKMQSNIWMDTGKDIVCMVQTYAQKVYKTREDRQATISFKGKKHRKKYKRWTLILQYKFFIFNRIKMNVMNIE